MLISTGKEGYGATRNLIAGGMTESLGKSGQYEAFRDAVIKSIPEDELAASVKKFQGVYGTENPVMIEREVVNEWVSNNLYNSSAIKQIVSADPQLATGVRNYFNELGSKLNGVDELKAVKQEIAQAEGMWERAISKYSNESGIDIQLRLKPGWTEEQILEAKAKIEALTKGKTIKTIPRRTKSASQIYKKAYGLDSIPKGKEIDHIIDLQLGGSDDIMNLHPLDKSVNRSLGKQIENATRQYPIGIKFGRFTIE